LLEMPRTRARAWPVVGFLGAGDEFVRALGDDAAAAFAAFGAEVDDPVGLLDDV